MSNGLSINRVNGKHPANGKPPAMLPPQNLEAEKCVLGSITFDNARLDDVQLVIGPAAFYLESHRRIYEAILRLSQAGIPFDSITIGEELEKAGGLEAVGGYEYLQEVIESVPHAAHAKYYAEQIRDRAIRRAAIFAAGDLTAAAHDLSIGVDDLLTAAETKLHGIIEAKVSGAAATATEISLEFLERLNSPNAVGIATGFEALDELLGGLKPGQLVIVAARPSVGKTAFAGSMSLRMAKGGTPVLIASMEQLRCELFERFVCSETGFSTDFLQRKRMRASDRESIEMAVNALADMPIAILEGMPRTVAEVAAQARLLRRRLNLGVVICDYLQLFSAEDRSSHRETQVAEISRGLKGMAVSLEIPVVALAQLNRAVETRENRRPRLSDLRESGAIEQDADVVMFIDRPATYNDQADPTEARVIVAKHRNGRTGDVPLHWDGNRMTFSNSVLRSPPAF